MEPGQSAQGQRARLSGCPNSWWTSSTATMQRSGSIRGGRDWGVGFYTRRALRLSAKLHLN
eukprot:6962716-Lingulodinium_polyedra.AAC.1